METRDLNSPQDVDQLERDVVRIQSNISTILSELGRRRQEFLELRRRMGNHRTEMIVTGAAIAFFAAAALLGGKPKDGRPRT